MTTAASYLFVPATRPDRVDKARGSAADQVIVDLEDAVAFEGKTAARRTLVEMSPGRPVHVRINACGSPDHEADLRAVASLASVTCVVLPKVESAEEVAAVANALPARVTMVALIETARGILAADHIARAGVARIMFGSADYLADIGAPTSWEVLAYPRSRLVVASRAAGLPAPVDGPTLVIDDEGAVRAEAQAAKALGMGAKLCIHPAQVSAVNETFRCSDEERRWALAVLAAAEAHGGGAFSFERSMVDEPILVRARNLLGQTAPSADGEHLT